jgi:fibro-slime domain-containing protein
MPFESRTFIALGAALTLIGTQNCSGSSDTGSSVEPGSGGTTSANLASGGASTTLGDSGLNGSGSDPGSLTGGSSSSSPGVYMLPDGFTPAELGGWQIAGPADQGVGSGGTGGTDVGTGGTDGDAGSDDCGTELLGIVRDFRRGDQDGGHADFETFTGSGEQDIVQHTLGADKKPVLAPGEHQFTTTEENFNQWYRNTDGVNDAYLIWFSFEPNNGVLTFQSGSFFPLDGIGWGNEGEPHNFHFTRELHTEFLYKGGETFTFTGDDDLWVFINNQLAIDLGGLHSEQTASVSLDAIAGMVGIEVGNNYPLDLFHAERHTDASNFRVDTNLEFTGCQIIVDPIVK